MLMHFASHWKALTVPHNLMSQRVCGPSPVDAIFYFFLHPKVQSGVVTCNLGRQNVSQCLWSPFRMQSVGVALEELLLTAQKQECLTVGIYESAQFLNT